jgi:hypothetical protein
MLTPCKRIASNLTRDPVVIVSAVELQAIWVKSITGTVSGTVSPQKGSHLDNYSNIAPWVLPEPTWRNHMKNSAFACTTALLLSMSGGIVAAQDQMMGDMPKIELPAACTKSSGEMSGQMMMSGQQMMEQMQGMGGNMNEARKGYMKAMMAMHTPMMQGAMAPDPDVAFNCAMIAHHLGAIEMAKVELTQGKDEESKKMAQKTIDQQGMEVEQMTKWLEKYAQ